ncbi:hypothetical protein CHARACLAT_008210 [Characodon lateralis]|uniref:Uncharacterized protein n=1 Tax=Characodon lateralis TaxID=208331 RepID=A0ABU7CQH6_9TELE|nr:hypothetical protein [Characodon lateralis]
MVVECCGRRPPTPVESTALFPHHRSPEELDGGTQRADVSLLANTHNSSNWIQGCHTIMRSYAQIYRSKLCSREFPAETLSLRRRVEQFSQSEGRTTGPHNGQREVV